MKKLILLVISLSVLIGIISTYSAEALERKKPIESITVMPPEQVVKNELYEITVRPVCHTVGKKAQGPNRCTGFDLTIENKSSQDIQVVWDKTMFINQSNTDGGFMFQGIVYKDRNNPKPPDIVFPKAKFNRVILPNNLVEYMGAKWGGWFHNSMNNGDFGVYLTLLVNGVEKHEKMTMSFTAKTAP